jgi:hypothetical protein
MPTGTLAIVGSIGGVTIQKTISETGDHANVYGDANSEIVLAAGKEVTDWVKTDADTAACSLASGHAYTDGKFDVYWDGGMRYDVDGTIVTNALSLDGGSGDDYPASATEDIVVCKHQQITTAIDGDEVQLLVVNATTHAHCHFEDADGDTIKDLELTANTPYTYHQSSGDASPLTGDPITVCYVTNGTTTDGVITSLSLEDSTP